MQIKEFIKLLIRDVLYEPETEFLINTAGGGSINETYSLQIRKRKYFIKLNNRVGRDFFKAEIRGLELLRNSGAVYVPDVVSSGEIESTQYLLLQYIDPRAQTAKFWEKLGESLALLHKNSSDRFGLDHSNYIGSLIQENSYNDNWNEFFHCRRVLPLAMKARQNNLLNSADFDRCLLLKDIYQKVFPEEAPALLHGDLWNGNVLAGSDGKAWFIDPAVYYGHREMDLAMTMLFGGFNPRFYESYNQIYPLTQGFNDRAGLYNLYPLLVHLNLFGEGYLPQVKKVLSEYSGN
jgi:protein-ribulosamine 3-kinase